MLGSRDAVIAVSFLFCLIPHTPELVLLALHILLKQAFMLKVPLKPESQKPYVGAEDSVSKTVEFKG